MNLVVIFINAYLLYGFLISPYKTIKHESHENTENDQQGFNVLP